MKNRDNFRGVARGSNDENDWKKYRIERNLCTKMLKRKKEEHYNFFLKH